MVQDDRFFQYRLRLFVRAREVGVSRACRELGYHRSWYYRWRPLVERHGLEILRRRERKRPRMPRASTSATTLLQRCTCCHSCSPPETCSAPPGRQIAPSAQVKTAGHARADAKGRSGEAGSDVPGTDQSGAASARRVLSWSRPRLPQAGPPGLSVLRPLVGESAPAEPPGVHEYGIMTLHPSNVAVISHDRRPLEDSQHHHCSGRMAPSGVEAETVGGHLGWEGASRLTVLGAALEEGLEGFGHSEDGSSDGVLSCKGRAALQSTPAGRSSGLRFVQATSAR